MSSSRDDHPAASISGASATSSVSMMRELQPADKKPGPVPLRNLKYRQLREHEYTGAISRWRRASRRKRRMNIKARLGEERHAVNAAIDEMSLDELNFLIFVHGCSRLAAQDQADAFQAFFKRKEAIAPALIKRIVDELFEQKWVQVAERWAMIMGVLHNKSEFDGPDEHPDWEVGDQVFCNRWKWPDIIFPGDVLEFAEGWMSCGSFSEDHESITETTWDSDEDSWETESLPLGVRHIGSSVTQSVRVWDNEMTDWVDSEEADERATMAGNPDEDFPYLDDLVSVPNEDPVCLLRWCRCGCNNGVQW